MSYETVWKLDSYETVWMLDSARHQQITTPSHNRKRFFDSIYADLDRHACWPMYMMVENQITMGFRVGGFEFETVEPMGSRHASVFV